MRAHVAAMPSAPPSPDMEPGPLPLELKDAVRAESRAAVAQRLIEVVSWPESRIPLFERQLAADILLGILRTSGQDLRSRCAYGLARIADAPKALLRYLACDEIAVAEALLETGRGFDESDLIAAVRGGTKAHWQAIARRRDLGEAATDALLQTGDIPVIETVLRNTFVRLSTHGVDLAVARSRQAPALPALLAQRPEMRPTQALVLFWWADHAVRVHLLRRFAVDRSVLIQELGETFALAAREGWADPETRKALQVIERRQRNRAAAAQSEFGSLEGAIERASAGIEPYMLNEIAHMGGVKPATAAQIFADPGGEAIAVFAKSVGLKRPMLLALWHALQRPAGDPERTDNALGRTLYVFDTLATAKAQTVLRYWNWSFTADVMGLENEVIDDLAEMPLARRNAALLFGRSG
ncbi:MAG: DUF2336 domain-containing protein [Hyphomonadaceae bacterium]